MGTSFTKQKKIFLNRIWNCNRPAATISYALVGITRYINQKIIRNGGNYALHSNRRAVGRKCLLVFILKGMIYEFISNVDN